MLSMKSHATLIIIRGIPGSGKTHLTDRLAAALDADQTVVLDPDATDYDSAAYKKHVAQQTAEGVNEALHPYRFLRAQAFQAIEDEKLILWNQPWTNRDSFHKVVERMQEYARDHDVDLTILIVEVEIDKATAKTRVDDRRAKGGHGPSDDRFARFVDDYESFADEGFPTLSINGADNIEKSVGRVKEFIKNS